MRVVIDTNIVISAVFRNGIPLVVYDAVGSEPFVLLSSEDLLAELDDVLRRDDFVERLRSLNTTTDQIMARHRKIVEMTNPEAIEVTILRDRKDIPLLESAISGRADVLITGDKHLLELGMPIKAC